MFTCVRPGYVFSMSVKVRTSPSFHCTTAGVPGYEDQGPGPSSGTAPNLLDAAITAQAVEGYRSLPQEAPGSRQQRWWPFRT